MLPHFIEKKQKDPSIDFCRVLIPLVRSLALENISTNPLIRISIILMSIIIWNCLYFRFLDIL